MLQLNWQGFYVLRYLHPIKNGLYGTRRYMFHTFGGRGPGGSPNKLCFKQVSEFSEGYFEGEARLGT
jgi:hypothetical protein